MATREKRNKTESPVPSTEFATATPPTPTKPSTPIKLKRMPGRKKVVKAGGENEDAESNISEDTQSSTTSETPKTPNTRKRLAKDKEKEDETVNGDVTKEDEIEENPKEKTDTTTEIVTKNKRKIKPPNKDLEPIVKRIGKGVTKRKVLAHKTVIGNKMKTNLRSRPKTDLKKISSDSELVQPVKKVSMRGAHFRRKPKPEVESKEDEKNKEEIEEETTENVTDEKESEITEDSQSEDARADIEMEETNDLGNKNSPLLTTIKTEKEEDEKQQEFSSDPSSIVAPSVRRSTRQRRSTFKDLESPLTTRKRHLNTPEIKQEKLDSEKPIISALTEGSLDDAGTKQIHIDIKPVLSDETPEVIEKDASLSPELVSEELDTVSVQQFLENNKPHFLENNLGIEQDPKLGEIVKVQEKSSKNNNEVKEDSDDNNKMDIDTDKSEITSAENQVAIGDVKDINGDEKQGDVKETDCSVKETVIETEMGENTQNSTEILQKVVEDTSTDQKVDEATVASQESSNDSDKKDSSTPTEDPQKETSQSDKNDSNSEDKPDEDQKEIEKETEKEEKSEKEELPENEPEELKMEIKEEKMDEDKKEEIEETAEDNKENNIDSNKSPRSEDKPSDLNESLETLKQKESHFLSLGLLTHKAADEAKIAKQKRKEELAKTAVTYSSASSSSSYGMRSKDKNKSNNGNSANNGNTEQYTGTLKTVIKLNKREEKRKGRLPLKMTFQKSKTRHDRESNGSSASENSFYTIHNEKDPLAAESHGGISRKSHNRSHTTTHDKDNLASNIESETSKEIEKSLVIPEKASSFKVHPERICEDQCFYCGGKFGLYDTPCHIAQIKSAERQNKILENEEKLTRDNCLCDACFRHVDRRANCPGYKKRLSASVAYQQQLQQQQQQQQQEEQEMNEHHPKSPEKHQQKPHDPKVMLNYKCDVTNCSELGSHTLRKKWLVKVKKSILRVIDINMDTVGNNTGTVAICEQHYEAISHLMVCAVCKRKLAKNHIFYISQEVPRLEQLINEQGLHIKLPNTTMVVCKLCRYYANLLIKPPEEKTQKAEFVQNYTKKLLHHNNNAINYDRNNVDHEEEDDEVQEVPIESGNITLTIKNGKIQPNKSLEMVKGAGNNEITIVSMKNSNSNSPAHGGRIVLDDDVMVGYDLPMMDPPSPPASYIENPRFKGKHGSKGNSSMGHQKHAHHQHQQHQQQYQMRREFNDNNEMARQLRANPNISMRELFPGEEEMGLNISIPFNIPGTIRTPEGWYKTQTTLQYDEPTKNLWEELQRPYGNQSSFIRHLILLEKYFRNGDLILSPSASSSATIYSESVRNRLRSYDNLPSNSALSISGGSTAFSNEITIIPAKLKKQNDILTITPATLTKTNVNDQVGQKRKMGQDTSPKHKEKSMRTEETPKKMPPPPELIKFNKSTIPQLTKQSTNSSHDKNQLNKTNSPPPILPSSITITPTTSSNTSTSPPASSDRDKQQDVIVLSDQLSPAELKEKGWRPTLIPITSSSQTISNSKGPLYQTVDGRRLPALVQVMSGGKPYHISIHDYNRMCLIRREKLQQQLAQKRPNMMGSSNTSPNLSITAVSKNQGGSENNKSLQSATTQTSQHHSPGTNSSRNNNNKLVSIPNQILEQNSLIPIGSNDHQKANARKLNANGNNNANNAMSIKNTTPQKSMNLPNISTSFMPLPPSTSAIGILPSTMASFFPNSALTSLVKTVNALPVTMPSWMMGSDGELSADAAQSLATLANFTALNNSVGGSILSDNSAANLLSKIPKSLTVIPQQKASHDHRKLSGEDQRHT